jgi:DNA-binding IclR family transcriptional regulator
MAGERTSRAVQPLIERKGGESAREFGGSPDAGYVVPAVVKTIAIVKMLNDRGAEGASLPELSEQLGITRSHCFSILRTMMAYGWVEYGAKARLYTLSSGIAADSSSALVSTAHLGTIRPYVTALSAATGFPCNLCEVIADGSFLVVCVANNFDPFVYGVPIGYRFPAASPHHLKAALAWLRPEQQAAALEAWVPVRFTSHTITERAALAGELRITRQRGYARSLGEFVEGFRTIALPVFNRDGNAFLVLSAFGREEQIAPREAEIATALVAKVEEIHLAIDARLPVDFPRRTAE